MDRLVLTFFASVLRARGAMMHALIEDVAHTSKGVQNMAHLIGMTQSHYPARIIQHNASTTDQTWWIVTLLLLSRYGLLRPLIANLTPELRCTPFGHGFTPTPNRELDTAAQCITPMTALGAIAGYGNDSHRQQLFCSCMFTERACRPPFQGAFVVRGRVFKPYCRAARSCSIRQFYSGTAQQCLNQEQLSSKSPRHLATSRPSPSSPSDASQILKSASSSAPSKMPTRLSVLFTFTLR